MTNPNIAQEVNYWKSDFSTFIHPYKKLFKDLDKLVFNWLKVACIEDAEIRHSNILKWFLNPNDIHGFGSLFLKNFIKSIPEIRKVLPGITKKHVDYNSIEVLREFHGMDIFIHFKTPAFIIVIENKINAAVDQKQLERYRTKVLNFSLKCPKFFVLLTLDKKILAEGWISIDYETLIPLIEKLLKKRLQQEQRVFIHQYLESVLRLTRPNYIVNQYQSKLLRIMQKYSFELDLFLGASRHAKYGKQEREIYKRYKSWFDAIRFIKIYPIRQAVLDCLEEVGGFYVEDCGDKIGFIAKRSLSKMCNGKIPFNLMFWVNIDFDVFEVVLHGENLTEEIKQVLSKMKACLYHGIVYKKIKMRDRDPVRIAFKESFFSGFELQKHFGEELQKMARNAFFSFLNSSVYNELNEILFSERDYLLSRFESQHKNIKRVVPKT